MKKRFVSLGITLAIVLALTMVFSASALAYQEVSVGECTFQIPDDFHLREGNNSTEMTEVVYINDNYDTIAVFYNKSSLFPYITTPESIVDKLRSWKKDAEAYGETDCRFIFVGDCPALLSHEDRHVYLRILNRYEWVMVSIISGDAERLQDYEATLIPLIQVSLMPVTEY